MQLEDSRRFAFVDSEEVNALWAAQYPNNGILYLGTEDQPFTISMFHEIRCIDIIRSEILQAQKLNNTVLPGRLVLHCLNYIRQMVLCRADMNADAVYQLPVGLLSGTSICNDWTKVYDATQKNHERYKELQG